MWWFLKYQMNRSIELIKQENLKKSENTTCARRLLADTMTDENFQLLLALRCEASPS